MYTSNESAKRTTEIFYNSAVRFTDLRLFWLASPSTEVLGYYQSSASPTQRPTFCEVHKVLNIIRFGCGILVVVIMLYGVIRYPHAPIRPRDGAYFDKAGHEVTQAQFHTFKTWEYCLFGSFGVLGIVSIPLAFSKRSRRAE